MINTSPDTFETWWSEYADIDSDKDSAKDAWQAGQKALEAEQAQQVAVPANKREPMTECEIFDIDPCPHEMFDQQRIAFARAIEAHHGITPQGDKTRHD